MIYLHHDHGHCHGHDHDHDHCHEHSHDCASCGSCDPMTETVALMQYMVNHNASHARELAALADQLEKLGNQTAAEQVRSAVGEFEKGNMRLSVVLASLK